MPERVLVIDDDDAILQLVTYNLRQAGFDVSTATRGEAALAQVAADRPDLIILDIELPDMDGFDVCRELRRQKPLPVLILSARDEEIDRVVAFELGADDYVVKPFSPRELVGRVKAILRRSARPAPLSTKVITHGPFQMDFESHEVTIYDRALDLTPTEYRILETLAHYPRRVFSREELALRIMGEQFSGSLRTVDVHIRHLRAKLAAVETGMDVIETVRGAGYRFVGA